MKIVEQNSKQISEILSVMTKGYQSPSKITVPNTTIKDLATTANRQAYDPANTLKPLFGIERHYLYRLDPVHTEIGPNGEAVWESNLKDGRVRFVGNWQILGSDTGTLIYAQDTTSYMEVFWYGTSLNLLLHFGAASLDLRVAIDNQAEGGTNLTPGTHNTVMNGRGYSPRVVVPIATNLSLGYHTAKIRRASGTSNFHVHGIEFMGAIDTNLRVLPGVAVNPGGANHVLTAMLSTPYNSGFDSGSIGAYGGRALVYSKGNNTIGKAATSCPVPGSNLITNGTFDTNTTGWVASSGAHSWSNDGTLLSDSGTTYWEAYQLVSGLVIGRAYTFKATFSARSNVNRAAGLRVREATTGTTIYVDAVNANLQSASDTLNITWVATATSARFAFYYDRNAAMSIKWDNATLVEEPMRFMSEANHINEEQVPGDGFSPREFGFGRSDDFQSGASQRAGVLEDNSTALRGDATSFFFNAQYEFLAPAGNQNYLVFKFTGTGIDILATNNGGASGTISFYIDDVLFKVDNVVDYSTTHGIKRLISGLPMGTHEFRMKRDQAGTGVGIAKFFVYMPKKPTLPDGALEITEYFVPATYESFTQGGSQTPDRISRGVIKKWTGKELQHQGAQASTFIFSNSFAYGPTPESPSGGVLKFFFLGTGFELRSNAFSNRSSSITLQIGTNGATPTNYTGAARTAGFGVTWSPGTSSIDFNDGASTDGAAFQLSGLPFGYHTVILTNNAAAIMTIESLDIITPFFFSDKSCGNLSCAKSKVEILPDRLDNKQSIDLSRAKAWLQYDRSTQRIVGSYGVMAVHQRGSRFDVMWEKPFKNANYVVFGMGNNYADGGGQMTVLAVDNASGTNGMRPNSATFCFRDTFGNFSVSGSTLCMIAFGEQEGEG